MKFLKDNSYDIVKMIINQIGISIFSLVLYTAAGLIWDIDVYLSVFAVLFYVALIYTAAWDMGAQDRVRIDSGKLKESPWRGVAVTGIANIPNAVLIVLAIIFMSCHISGGGEGAYTAFALVNLIFRLICAMYIGVLTAMFPEELVDGAVTLAAKQAYLYQSIGYLVFLLVPIVAGGVGYYLGTRNFRVFNRQKSEK